MYAFLHFMKPFHTFSNILIILIITMERFFFRGYLTTSLHFPCKNLPLQSKACGAGEIVYLVGKGVCTKPEDLSLNPRIIMVERED